MSNETILRCIRFLRQIPDELRTFAADELSASALGLDSITTNLARTAGMPYRIREGVVRYEASDLINLSLECANRSPHRTMFEWMLREESILTRTAGTTKAHVGVISAACPLALEGECDWWSNTTSGPQKLRLKEEQNWDTHNVEVRHIYHYKHFPHVAQGVLRQLLEESENIHFLIMPDTATSKNSLSGRGVADCRLAVAELAKRASNLGLEFRVSYGQVTCPPIAFNHHWLEFAVDGRWLPFDPVLVRALTRWKVKRSNLFNPLAVFGATFGRMGPTAGGLIEHRGPHNLWTMQSWSERCVS